MRTRGWISDLQMEQQLSELANKLAVKYWLRHTGKETMKLVDKGKLRNMVVELKDGIPMVQTRFKRKSHHYFAPTTKATDLVIVRAISPPLWVWL